MAFCTKCGANVPDGTAFCQACGAPMAAAAPQQAAPQQAAPAPAPQPQPQPAPAAPAFDPYDHTAEFDPKDISDNKVIAMAAYLLGALGILIAVLASRESKYASFHVRQSLKIQVTSILITFFMIIPFLGWFAAVVCYGIIFVLEIIMFFGVAGGKAKEVPILRSFPFFK